MKPRSHVDLRLAILAVLGTLKYGLAGSTNLPVPCAAGTCGVGVSGFVTAGAATAVQSGTHLTVNQTTNSATLNWQSFNISSDGSVQFVQPNSSSVALNRIFQLDPSAIFGSLTANGRVFLINQNGIVFGPTAQVNVGGLLASTLDINPFAVTNGLVGPAQNGQAAFQNFDNGLPSGSVVINQGASLKTPAGGQVLIFAPTINNEGNISTPGGQTILAAGNQIWLATSSDPNLRGLLVEIGGVGGTVTNGSASNAGVTSPDQLIGQISASLGNVTLAGLAVNQLGRVSATTSINQNGTIYLQARDHSSIDTNGSPLKGTGGSLTLGVNSVDAVDLALDDTATTVDSVAQPKSTIALAGATVDILDNSMLRATSGNITVDARVNQAAAAYSQQGDGSRVYVAPDAVLDVSGANITLPVSSNVIAVQLRGTEFADDPLQRNGPLRGQTVYVDVRASGVSNGVVWQGTPLANVTGEIAAIPRDVAERNLTGGTISLNSQGDVILAAGSRLDVAGGSIQYTGGNVNTSTLLTTAGQAVSISNADPNVTYAGILDPSKSVNPKWGVSVIIPGTESNYQPGYLEGKDAGGVKIVAPQFVLDGSVDGSVQTGIFQRQPTGSVQLAAGLSPLYRPYNEVPMSGALTIGAPGSAGADFVAGSVSIQPGLQLAALKNPDGSAFDPLSAEPLPIGYSSVLRPDLFGGQGLGSVFIYANDKIVDSAGSHLQLAAGGAFGATSSRVDLEGAIDAPGGSITAASVFSVSSPSTGLTLGPEASLTARGEWVNDALASRSGLDSSAPLYLNGGKIALSASDTNLNLEAGSLIDVSGGAQMTTQGALVGGNGGSIALSASTSSGVLYPNPTLELHLGSTLAGYGVSKGGSLSLTAQGICIASADCTGGDATMLWLTPSALSGGGFGAYTLKSQQGGLAVEPGTNISLQQQNWQLPANVYQLANAASLTGIATPGLLPDLTRLPVNLTLSTLIPFNGLDSSGLNTLTVTPTTASLMIGKGASVSADPGAQITLTSNSRIIDDGNIVAHGGTISVNLDAGLTQSKYEPTQAIWLGQDATLDASGLARFVVGDTGLRTGTVLAGGTVSITASRGSIELLPGSTIDVSGSAAVLDVAPPGGGLSIAQQVASAGGNINLSAAENIVAGGALRAAAGTAAGGAEQPLGGSLSVALDASQRNDNLSGTSGFSTGRREIIVAPTQPALVVGAGTAVPDSVEGQAFISTDAINSGDFGSVALRAGYLRTAQGFIAGSIDLANNVSLTAGRQVTLDAATYTVTPGTTAQVSAPYVLFGNSDDQFHTVPGATTGTGTLDVSAGFLELYGVSALQGIATANFASSGDLRLRGIQNLNIGTPSTAISGALSAAGNLNLSATQIYPTTLSQFTLSSDPTTGTITINPAPGTPQDVLSAGGSITLSADNIVQNGTLRAPFGEISLVGNSVKLGAGSLTSTSANGLTVPFGTTQGGFDWVYPLQDALNVIYGTDGIAPPAQQVRLQGAQVNVASGAVVNVAGGGDLQAFEWINGVGGTQDVLSQLVRPNQFAILPSLNASVAPYDPLISQGSNLQLGQSVYLAGMPGLPAGMYVLLPARYALLPGAFLVSQVSGYQDIQPGQAFSVASGGSIIAGRTVFAGTDFGDSRTSGFEVVPASVVLQQAQYTTTGANNFFSQQALASKTTSPALPRDSGLLSLAATDQLQLDGKLITTPGAGGTGAAVDIASSQIVVAADDSTPVQAGQILLSAASLDALGAQSLLIGGQRTGSTITTAAQSVVVESGVTLNGPEIILAAQDQIAVNSGASISAAGSAATTKSYSLEGDGALLRVSASPQASVVRADSAGATGILTLAQGSNISANGGSIYLDASANILANGSLSATGGDLAVQSTHLNVGDVPQGTAGTVLGANILGIQGLRNLQLISNSSIDFFGSASISAQQLTLDAGGLQGFGTAGDTVSISVAQSLTLQNTQNISLTTTPSGSGSISLAGTDFILGQGDFALSGFKSVSLSAQNSLQGSSNSVLSTPGDLNISASRLTGTAGSTLAINAGGAVSIGSPSTAATLPAVTDLGATLEVSGSSVALNTSIDLPSGRVMLTSTGVAPGDGLTLGANANINVAGLTRTYDTVNVATPGGLVSLTSAQDLSLAAGSVMDVGAAPGGIGGTLTISASNGTATLAGTLRGAGVGQQGSQFSIDAQNFGDFAALNQSLNSGGFAGTRAVRLRGAGDIVVSAAGSGTVTANRVALEADQGSVVVQGTIDASGSTGGQISLLAGSDIDVTGVLDAHATGTNARGGKVELDTDGGRVLVESSASINLSGSGTGQGGTLYLRAPRDEVFAVASGGNGVSLAGKILGASKTTLEAFQVYQNSTGSISAEDVSADPSNPLFQDAATLWNTPGLIAQVTAGLGSGAAGPGFVLLPGVEIQAQGDLSLSTPWNLYTWRFGPNADIPGVLTVRATGALTVDSQLSDGFAAPSVFKLPTTASDSWSYRLVAGADLSSANPLSINLATPADFTITAGTLGGARGQPGTPKMVRTGDGFIDVAASGNFILGNQASVLYTAGVVTPGVSVFGRTPAQALQYMTNGGDININAGGNIEGAVTNQFVTAWQWRTAGDATATPPLNLGGPAVSWTTNFSTFQQGVGALAGGNVTVNAGGDITNFSASIPSIGVQTASRNFPNSNVDVIGGGQLTVTAGGSILGGSYYVGLGSASLRAGEDIGVPAPVNGVSNASPLLGVGDASVAATAGRNLQVSGIVDPMLLPPGQAEGIQPAYFTSFGKNSSATLTAVGGDLTLVDESGPLQDALNASFLGGGSNRNQAVAFNVAPPVLNAYALSGNVDMSRTLVLSPAANGNLQVFADKSYNAGLVPGAASQFILADGDPALLPNIANPTQDLQGFADIAAALTVNLPDQHAATPVHASDNTAPALVVARTGDIVENSALGGFWSAKPIRLVAAGDVVNLDLVAQNIKPSDVTSISAGGSISYPFARTSLGLLVPNLSQITIDGPGELQLEAGGNVNLGTSLGITTRGNLVNPALASGGAGVSVEAGVSPGAAQYAAFITNYVLNSDDFDAELISFVANSGGIPVKNAADAKSAFGTLSPQLQREFVEQTYFALLRDSGRTEARLGNGDFSKGFTAIETLFPGGNPSAGQSNPYSGDIALYFSQIYTLQGGSISLLAPGGLINVGLAAAPSSFGVFKTPAQLGLVAQSTGDLNAYSFGDFEVNQSRVFAADGGNILVWSTGGDIDAGRGSKTAISAPPPTITVDQNGIPVVTFPSALTGSGIQALATSPGVGPGDVDLFAPHGVVNANDAGIVAGNLTIAATAVLGTSNISVSGTSVGVPVTVTGLGAGAAAAAGSAGSATNAAQDAAAQNTSQAPVTSAGESALGWLDVFVTGLGEEQCKPDDVDCIKRQKQH